MNQTVLSHHSEIVFIRRCDVTERLRQLHQQMMSEEILLGDTSTGLLELRQRSCRTVSMQR